MKSVSEASRATSWGFGIVAGPVSVDFKGDPRSAIVDAGSTMVVDGTCVKILAWYDNEIGYVHRMAELARKVGAALA